MEGGATGRRQLNTPVRISRKIWQKFIYKADSFRRSGCLSGSGARGDAMAETNIEVRSRDGTLTAPWANQISRHSLLHPPPRPRTITPPLDHYFDARLQFSIDYVGAVPVAASVPSQSLWAMFGPQVSNSCLYIHTSRASIRGSGGGAPATAPQQPENGETGRRGDGETGRRGDGETVTASGSAQADADSETCPHTPIR